MSKTCQRKLKALKLKVNDRKYNLIAAALGAEIPYKFVMAVEVAAIHDEMVQVFGGTPGLRDAGMLESAVGRQLQTATYGCCDIPNIAASLAFGITQNHAFLDGNKRTAFGAMVAFLDKNAVEFDCDPVEVQQIFVELAAGTIGEPDMAEWVTRITGFSDILAPKIA